MGKCKCKNIIIPRVRLIKLIHIQNLLPDLCLRLPILDLISDKMQSWRQFLPYVWRLRKSLQCQLLLKLYCPSSSYINTHPKILAHMCAHWNTILILHLSDCYHVNENILLSDFCVSLYICSANALSWLEQFQIFELWNWEDCVVRLWKSLQYASLWGVCRYTRLRNKKKMYCLKGFSIKKSPVVWTQLSAVSELTSKPLNSL